MTIGIANDHGGVVLKQKLTKYLTKKGYNIINYGTDTLDSVDYPDYALKVCDGIINKEIYLGIVICKTGIGMSIACNKKNGIRCAKVSNTKEAYYSRNHNNANIIALGADASFIEIKDIIDIFLTTEFSNEERHINRLQKIESLEGNN